LDEEITLARYERHTIEVIYDRLRLEPERRSRLSESVEKSLELSGGLVNLVVEGESHLRSSLFACPRCEVSLQELEPRLFSFNSPHGACPRCEGLGRTRTVALQQLIPDPSRTLREGAITTTTISGALVYSRLTMDDLEKYGEQAGFDLDTPWQRLPAKVRERILFGKNGGNPQLKRRSRDSLGAHPGIVSAMEEAYRKTGSKHVERWLSHGPCPDCNGTRLRPEARSVFFRERSIVEISALTAASATRFTETLQLEPREQQIGGTIIREIRQRLDFLARVGLGYLTLDRSADTLSGGEAQRIRLASQLGSGLKGVLYVLDEPSIGLHSKDNQALLEILRRLRDLGNSVLVVEHDRDTIEAADFVVELGPGAGSAGGEVVEAGGVAAVRRNAKSITGQYLSGKKRIEIPKQRRKKRGEVLVVRGACQHNLQNIDVEFPLGLFIAVTGVSGSGKSTLVENILHRAVARHLGREAPTAGLHQQVEGLRLIDKVIRIDQSPIGRTPRSNPGTYTKVFDDIRTLFASLPEARVRGYSKGRFSFNVKGGRCENCGGAGVITIPMQFLADVEVGCDECSGHRYNPETLQVKYRGSSIYEILELPIADATEFFVDHPRIHRTLNTLVEVGLGYVKLGQPSTTLSGGEAQRVKLAQELRKSATGKTLYLLDEPTTGLHFDDIRRLLAALDSLVDQGNTVIVIEHNLDVIKVADHVIDLGPGAGEEGGRVVAAGTPEQVARMETATGAALAVALRHRKARVSRKGMRKRGQGEPQDRFVVVGARQNNLKNLRVEIPRGKMTVITGPSGSGKSTLAFDILFAEGQRRYVESLSTYARRFLGRLQRADVDRVEGIAPAIAIDQKNRSTNPRSTVATTTELYDYLRLLYSRIGSPHCPKCQKPLVAASPSTAARAVEEAFSAQPVYILAPLHLPGVSGNILTSPQQFARLATELLGQGFVRVMVAGEVLRIEELPEEPLDDSSEVLLVVDRLAPGKVARSRLAESIEEAYRQSSGKLQVRRREAKEWLNYTRLPSCPDGHFALQEELTPRLFSFNHHSGACPRCHGLGSRWELNPELLLTDPSLPLFDGAMEHRMGSWIARDGGRVRMVIEAAFSEAELDLGVPVKRLRKKARAILFDGTGKETYAVTFRSVRRRRRSRWRYQSTWEGLTALVRRWYERAGSPRWRAALQDCMTAQPCSLCRGGRLRRELLQVKVGGRGIHEIGALSIQEAVGFFRKLELPAREALIAKDVLQEIANRLRFLNDVGLDYLTLDRVTETLSGGEAQRIRLATQIGNRLVGVLYVLDEPTIGLHERDNARLLRSLLNLR
ncbi:MAG: excinuclease ABC subunit UvrA, partial [Planctomycetota bacterium]